MLRALAKQVAGLRWTGKLLAALVEELHADVDDGIADYVGEVRSVPLRRYPQVVAMALALRHSWSRADFRRFIARLRAAGASRSRLATARNPLRRRGSRD